MSNPSDDKRQIVVERHFACSPDKLWRALTERHLMADWLMPNDFEPKLGHQFSLEAPWGEVCAEVLILEPQRKLAYSWNTKDLESIVTWVLVPTESGTVLRMEQVGFSTRQESYYQGALTAWPRFFSRLERNVDLIEKAEQLHTKEKMR